MGHEEHQKKAPRRVGVALVTVSTSREEADDRSGPLMAALVAAQGHEVVERRLVRDGIGPIGACLAELAGSRAVQAVLLSGGSGITADDQTVEAVAPHVQAWIPGFGELFRQLSYAEIGPAAMLSRACAAVCKFGGRRLLVAVLPGSPEAVRLALERLLLPELGHLLYEIDRRSP